MDALFEILAALGVAMTWIASAVAVAFMADIALNPDSKRRFAPKWLALYVGAVLLHVAVCSWALFLVGTTLSEGYIFAHGAWPLLFGGVLAACTVTFCTVNAWKGTWEF